ncbi:MAG TPA: PAS domain S-box protein, partial [Rhodopila sp.]|nr:PAS domain S-box protein [Rhodopila sp.]
RLVHFESLRMRKDGTAVPVSLTISPIRDSQGRIVGVSKIARDLSEIQRAHREVQHREALLRSILDTVPDALIVINAEGCIESCSMAAEQLFGYGAAEVAGRGIGALFAETELLDHDIPHLAASGREQGRVPARAQVMVGRRKDGTTFPLELAVGQVNLPDARLFTVFVRDLTERRAHERRINELQAELIHVARLNDLGQLVSALAHEVNQPLTAVMTYLSAIRRLIAAEKPEPALQAVEKTFAQADRARQIIQRLRELARKGATERRAEDLPNTIEEAGALALLGVSPEPRLEIQVDANATTAVIDKVQVQQVLLNLMRNAAEAMVGSSRRELVVSTARLGDMVEISVADSGPGLPDSIRSRLFEPFNTTKPNGMGVGLSVCRSIVEAHGGVMCAESAQGGGTVFRFTVPRADHPVQGA